MMPRVRRREAVARGDQGMALVLVLWMGMGGLASAQEADQDADEALERYTPSARGTRLVAVLKNRGII